MGLLPILGLSMWEGGIVRDYHPCKCELHTGDEKWHGTVNGYSGHGCSCLDCRWAWNNHCKNSESHKQHVFNREHARRARKFNVESEKYTRLEIAERDNWICGICCHKIQSNLKWPDPGSFTVDHVTPISRGGTDTKSNVQAAHASCNWSKNAQENFEIVVSAP